MAGTTFMEGAHIDTAMEPASSPEHNERSNTIGSNGSNPPEAVTAGTPQESQESSPSAPNEQDEQPETLTPDEAVQEAANREQHAERATDEAGARAMTEHPAKQAAIKELTIETKTGMRAALTRFKNNALSVHVVGTEGLDDQTSREMAWAMIQETGGLEEFERGGGMRVFKAPDGRTIDLNRKENAHLAKLLDSRATEIARAARISGAPKIVGAPKKEDWNPYTQWMKAEKAEQHAALQPVLEEVQALQEQNAQHTETINGLKENVSTLTDTVEELKAQNALLIEQMNQLLEQGIIQEQPEEEPYVDPKLAAARKRWEMRKSNMAQPTGLKRNEPAVEQTDGQSNEPEAEENHQVTAPPSQVSSNGTNPGQPNQPSTQPTERNASAETGQPQPEADLPEYSIASVQRFQTYFTEEFGRVIRSLERNDATKAESQELEGYLNEIYDDMRILKTDLNDEELRKRLRFLYSNMQEYEDARDVIDSGPEEDTVKARALWNETKNRMTSIGKRYHDTFHKEVIESITT